MKYLVYLLLLSLLMGTQNLNAQNFDLKWSQKMQYDNFKDGFFQEFVGSTDQYVYGIYNNLALTKKRKSKQMKLIAFDKKTMKKVGEFPLKSKKDKSRNDKLKDFQYSKTVVLKDAIYVFWTKTSKSQTDVYAESFDVELDRKEKLKKVYTAKAAPAGKKLSSIAPAVVILNGKDGNNDLLIGSEIAKGKGENIEFDYITMDSDFKEVDKGHITLPIAQTTKFAGLSSYYEYGTDGNLYIKSYVRMSKDERKAAKKGEYSAYSILSVVDVATGDITPYTMKYDGLNIFNFDLVTEGGEVRIYGFFNDMDKDPSGLRTHGIFYTTIDKGQMDEPKFSYFDKKTLAELFKNDAEDKKKTYGSKRKKEKNKPMDEEALDESYVIEIAKIVDKDNIVLFCSKVYNYTVTTCTATSGGGQTCTTNYYCRKSNVTAFKLNNDGEIVWASNVDRLKTYSGWDIYDMRVVSDKNKFYVIYGSSYDVDATKKSRKTAKNRKEVRDNFEYAVFDMETGKSKKSEFVVNQPGVKKKDRKIVSPLAIQVFDNQFFVNSSRVTMKPWLTAAGCTVSLACPPVLYYVFISGDMRKGTGYLGTIQVVK